MRAVLDTNIAVAGLLWRGKPYELFGLTLTKSPVLCERSPAGRTRARLGYEKLARRIATLHTTIPDLLAGYRSLVEIVPAATISPTVIADPDDDHVLACAIAANADFIISGDKHLLDLKRHQGIEIVNAGEALRRITQIE